MDEYEESPWDAPKYFHIIQLSVPVLPVCFLSFNEHACIFVEAYVCMLYFSLQMNSHIEKRFFYLWWKQIAASGLQVVECQHHLVDNQTLTTKEMKTLLRLKIVEGP